MKKFIIAMSVVGMISSANASNLKTVFGPGNDKCWRMIIATQEQRNIDLYQIWITGYLTALNIDHPSPVTIQGVWRFIQWACPEYPEKTLSQLMQEYLMNIKMTDMK